MYASDYFEDGVLNALKGITFTAPADVYLTLCISDPTDTGLAGAEITYTGYARKKITFTAPAAESGGIGFKNDTEVKFAESKDDSATITHIKIMDSIVGGNMLLYGKLNEDKPIKAGVAPVLRVGECVYWVNGDMSNAFKTKMLNVLRKQSLIGFKPYLTLFNGNPQSGGNELSGGSFKRTAIEFGAPNEGTGGQRSIKNSAAVEMPISTQNLGIFDFHVIYDSQTGGTPIQFKQSNADTYSKGDMVFYPIESMEVRVN